MNLAEIPVELLNRFRTANRVVALTGAGVSAESGVPTFREAQTGLWASYDPQQLATPVAFREHPERVWQWYTWRRQLLAQARPNPGHVALATLEKHIANFTLITQNVDGLHQQAGSENVVELHGNLSRSKCVPHGHIALAWDDSEETPPRCERCGGVLRPDVVWFGEALPAKALYAAFEAAGLCDIFLTIGTSSLVHPAATIPLHAGESGAYLVEINVTSTPLTPRADCVLVGRSGELLPELARALLEGP